MLKNWFLFSVKKKLTQIIVQSIQRLWTSQTENEQGKQGQSAARKKKSCGQLCEDWVVCLADDIELMDRMDFISIHIGGDFFNKSYLNSYAFSWAFEEKNIPC